MNTLHDRMIGSIDGAKRDFINACATKPQNDEHAALLRETQERSSELYYRLSKVLYGETKDARFLNPIRP